MSNPVFVVPLSDLERGPKAVKWSISADWLRHALSGTDAVPNGDGELDLELTKTGRDVVVRGRALAAVTMPCSRTLDPVQIPIEADMFLMLAQTHPPEGAERPRARERGSRRKAEAQRQAPAPADKRKSGWDDDPVLTDDDVARDTFVGDQIVLDSFVREFILLELPMFPLRSDLPSDAPAAIAPASPRSGAFTDGGDDRGSEPRSIDPRLAPLAEIKARLKNGKE